MSVPTPPAVEDYTQTVYTFNDGALTNQITSLIAANDGSYKVSYIRNWVDDFSIVAAVPSLITEVKAGTYDKTSGKVTADGEYKIGATILRKLDDWTGMTFKAGETELYLHDGKFYTDKGFQT